MTTQVPSTTGRGCQPMHQGLLGWNQKSIRENMLNYFSFFVFDLGCPTMISQVTLRNSHNADWNNWAVKDWKLEIGSSWTGPWSQIASGSLASPFPLRANNQLPIPLEVKQFAPTMAQVGLQS